MVHLRRQMQIGDARTDAVKLDTVLVRDECVFLPVQEKDRALGLGYQVYVTEALINDYSEETGPS